MLVVHLGLIALGLLWGRDAYLKSYWNWLDGIVVMVSIINMVSSSQTGFLKTLRILRAFRPLRVISRNENLKIVVTTIFASMPPLLTLVIVVPPDLRTVCIVISEWHFLPVRPCNFTSFDA
eukprot:Skav212872  [mRNA]  locus=scaffold151:89082:92823:- [translate_table: standard]